MRATMSLPLIFPPVRARRARAGRRRRHGQRAGRRRPGDGRGRGSSPSTSATWPISKTVNYSMLGLAGADARRDDARQHEGARSSRPTSSSTCRSAGYGSLDWRRSDELIAEGYKAAEAMRDTLLPLAVSEAEFARVEGRPSGAPADRAAGAGVRRASKASARPRRAAPRPSCWPATSASPFDVGAVDERPRGALRPRPLRDDHLAHSSPTRPARPACSSRRGPKPYGAAVPDAGPQPREHDVRAIFRITLTGALSRLRRRRIRLGAARRRHDRIGSERWRWNSTSRSARRRCSSRRTRASATGPST